jgi:hypothetical protein
MGKKRINKITGEYFKQGFVREDGYIFKSYEFSFTDKNGFSKEKWMSPQYHLRWRMAQIIKNSKSSRRRGNIPKENNLTIDYLLKIFPNDFRCPVFGYKMEWGGETTIEKDTSPSLDRIDPNLGYIVGNVHFISVKVNRVKSDQNTERLVELGDWAKKILVFGVEEGRSYHQRN